MNYDNGIRCLKCSRIIKPNQVICVLLVLFYHLFVFVSRYFNTLDNESLWNTVIEYACYETDAQMIKKAKAIAQ